MRPHLCGDFATRSLFLPRSIRALCKGNASVLRPAAVEPTIQRKSTLHCGPKRKEYVCRGDDCAACGMMTERFEVQLLGIDEEKIQAKESKKTLERKVNEAKLRVNEKIELLAFRIAKLAIVTHHNQVLTGRASDSDTTTTTTTTGTRSAPSTAEIESLSQPIANALLALAASGQPLWLMDDEFDPGMEGLILEREFVVGVVRSLMTHRR